MWRHFLSLIQRVFNNFLAQQGTTTWGFVSNWIPSIISALVAALVILRLRGKQGLIEHWGKNLGIVFASAILGNLLWYMPILGWTLVKTVYRDHEAMQAKIIELTDSAQQLRTKSPYEKSFMGSFAYINTVGAFGYLTRDPRHQPDMHSDCLIKITTSDENRPVANSLRSIASAAGCYVVQEPYDPDLDAETLHEIKNSTLNFMVIHGSRSNSRADGFLVGMSNTFHVQRAYDLPPNSPPNLLWLQIGPGSIWRISK
jgi:hypothetical protein